ncbi:MAG TPA: M1 family metallopeptidase [Chitinophagaceae bacterium]|nr:M1 family metallopeptidase [Chitinophagaceae bacterium]
MRSFLLVLLLFTAFLAGAQDLRSGGVLKPEQANMDIRHYTVTLSVDPSTQTIDGQTETDLVLASATDVLLFDLTNVLTVKKIWVNGTQQDFTHNSDLIHIKNKTMLQPGPVKVRIAYGGKPFVAANPPWKGGFQWAKDSLGNAWISVSCQGEGAKVFFPCKDHPSDEPNEGADMIITVPKGLVVAGPGLLKKTTHKGNTSTYHWATNYTISNYCIVFNAGKYTPVRRTYTSVAGNKIPMVFYVLDYHASKAPHHLEMLERSCRILEKYFGEYPWAKEQIGIVETPHLGMEHQTMNAYGNRFRYTKVGGEDFDWLLHHEFGHEWWANKVSNIDWAHMWIQEGICSFGDALYYREMEGEESYQRRMRNTARNFSGRAVVLADTADSDLAYTGDIYGKGSYFMHSLRYLIGDDIFFPTLMKLATDPQYTYHNMVSTQDVEQLFSKAAGKNLKPFFDFYLRTTNRFEILVKQTAEDKYKISLLNFSMPLPIEITTHEGVQKLTIDKTAVEIQSTIVPGIDKKGFYYKRVILE